MIFDLALRNSGLPSDFSSNQFDLTFRTGDPSADSLVLWFGASASDDFIALGIKNQRVEFRYELGDGVGVARANSFPINTNMWYSVSVRRQVDPEKQKSEMLKCLITPWMGNPLDCWY